MKCRTFESYEELVADYEEGNLHPGDLKPSLSRAINKILQVIAFSVLIKLGKVEFDIAQRCTICSLIDLVHLVEINSQFFGSSGMMRLKSYMGSFIRD